MNKAVVVAVALGTLFCGTISAQSPTYPPINRAPTLYATHDFRGKTAPQIEVQQWLTGPLPNLKGKVILVDFWATWCPPCRATIPELGQWQKKFSKDLVVIGISDEKKSVVKDFMKTHPMPYNVGIDAKNKMSIEVGVQGIPHVMVISPDGIVRWQGFPLNGQDTLTEKTIKQIIDVSKAASK